MAQNTHHITLHLGETHREIVTLSDSSGERLSLRGYAAYCVVQNRSAPYGYEILRVSTGDGGIRLEHDQDLDESQSRVGTLTLTLHPGHIQDVLWSVPSAKQAVYTLTLVAPNGDRIPVLGGSITIVV
jgi:hypothetical protein